jgi:Tfp pilus assembly protein PilN
MIRINLLPQQAGGKAAAKSSAPQSGTVMVTMILLVALLVTFGVFGFFFSQKLGAERELKEVNDKLAAAKTEKGDLERRYTELRANLEVLRKQDRVLQVLDPPEGRLYWAQKLNILPAYLPEGVYLTKIQVTEDVKEVETRESRQRYQKWVQGGKKGKAPARDYTPIIKQKLQMDGIAYKSDGTSDQRLDLIIQFYNNLEDQKVVTPFNNEEASFMDAMTPNILFDPFDQAEVGGRPVTRFRFHMVSRPVTADSAEAETAAGGTAN